jgi:hypothetical protein
LREAGAEPADRSRAGEAFVLPFPIWREAFINDVDLLRAEQAYRVLNSYPFKTFTDKIKLSANPADMAVAKSYISAWRPMIGSPRAQARASELCRFRSWCLGL